MSLRLNALVAGLVAVSFARIGHSMDPVSIVAPASTFPARMDAQTPNTTLISLSNAPLTLQSEVNYGGAHVLPVSTVAAIREVYVWAWPLVYISNLKQSMQLVRSAGRSGGAPVAPVNSMCMLTDVVTPQFQSVPCPNRDVVYGFGIMDLKDQPVVIQVPDFGNRFWLYQIGDHRMESMGRVGSMYGTPSGFIMVVGPDWDGPVPEQITQLVRSRTNLAYVLPRIAVRATDEYPSEVDEQWNAMLNQIVMYPLAHFNGRPKQKDWSQVRWYPALGRTTRERNKLVRPETFFQDLQRVLNELKTTSVEQPLAELAEQLGQAANSDPQYQAVLRELAIKYERETIQPMFDLTATAQSLPGHWHSLRNGAVFGNDYWTRTAVAKSNPFVNREQEAKYFYLERSLDGEQLQGGRSYTVHFEEGDLPPADGFWSLTLYNEDHQFYLNDANRYSVGDLSSLNFRADGSLTILVQPEAPTHDSYINWLPSPSHGRFKLYLRLYQPKAVALEGRWNPPPAVMGKSASSGDDQ